MNKNIIAKSDGITTSMHVDNVTGQVALTHTADGEALFKRNKEMQNSPELTRTKNGRMVASIPLHILHDLEKRGITKDRKKFKAWLNNPDNRYFRTDLSMV